MNRRFSSTRRRLLKSALAATAGWSLNRGGPIHAQESKSTADESQAAAAVESAHETIWRRFIDRHNLLLDYTARNGDVPRPTADDCRQCKPNALAWWTPIENGAMFNGMYLDGACLRWKRSGLDADRDKADRLASGLLLLNSISEVPGFIGRGVADDGRTPYPMGSNDQTGPWLVGLWRYLREVQPTGELRTRIVDQWLAVARALEASGWRMPCSGGPSLYRGGFAGFAWEHAPRLLFLLKAAQELSGDEHWRQLYERSAAETGGSPALSRADICAAGMRFHRPEVRESWTGASGVIALRALWEMERDESLKAKYLEGLRRSADLAAGGIELHRQFNNADESKFLYDWRELNAWWRPQQSEAEAVEVAELESKQFGRLSPRRGLEFRFVREPLFASWIVTMCPDAQIVAAHRAAIVAALAHYQYQRLYYSQFFPAEAAWYRLQMLGSG